MKRFEAELLRDDRTRVPQVEVKTALKGLEKIILAGRLRDRNKMERTLGNIQARHRQVKRSV